MPLPCVTVLMPVYNGEIYLREAIESILSQTFTDFEFLIINDGSTDKSEKIIKSYNDSRIRYVKNESNLKLIATLNNGIELAKGKYILRMDADDISVPNRIEKQVAFMEQNPEIGLCGTWFNTFDEQGEKGRCTYAEDHDKICFKHLYQIHLSHGTSIIRKSTLMEFEFRFDKNFAHAEDYDLFTRMSLKTKLANLPYVGYHVRHHENEVSVIFNDIQRENVLKVRKRLFDLFDTKSDDSSLLAFEELNHQNYKGIKLSVQDVKLMLESLILGNQKYKYIDNVFFEKEIKILWLSYCYHASTLLTYRESANLYNLEMEKSIPKIKWVLNGIKNQFKNLTK
jgi:glycosyltransferase involved in cell wall biosynthesis